MFFKKLFLINCLLVISLAGTGFLLSQPGHGQIDNNQPVVNQPGGINPLNNPDSSKPSSASINKLVAQTHNTQVNKQVFERMLPLLKQLAPEMPAEFWQAFRQKYQQQELTRYFASIYKEKFSQAEVDALNEFYKTSAGQKLLAIQPDIAAASLRAGQALGQQIVKDVQIESAAYTQNQLDNADR